MTLSFFISASLYPSICFPQRGLFVEKRLLALKDYYKDKAEFHLFAPTPYFPFKNAFFGTYAKYAEMPHHDNRAGLDIHYLRHLHMPLIGYYFSAEAIFWGLEREFLKLRKKPDILISEYSFPDGLALAMLGKKYNIPVITTARGSDISYFYRLPAIRKKLETLRPHIHGFSAMSHDMKNDLIDAGFESDKIRVIGNGVDQNLFDIVPTNHKIREKYNIQTQYIVISVGGLIQRKGHGLAIRAIQHLKDVTLLIAGEGEEYSTLKMLAADLNIADRVILAGRQTQSDLCKLYNAADLFLLCSYSEGRANVLLEAASCGLPLISSDVQGSNEIITSDEIGTIFKDRNPLFLADIIEKMLKNPLNRAKIRHSIQPHSWQGCAENYAHFIEDIIKNHKKSD